MCRNNITLDNVLSFIKEADDTQVSEIIQTLVARYKEVYPDWDVTFLSLPTNDPIERKNMIQGALDFFNI